MIFLIRVRSKLISILNLFKLIIKFKNFGIINQVKFNNFLTLRGASINDLEQLMPIYKKLNGMELSTNNIKLLKYCSKKLIVIAEKEIDGRKKIVGMDLFYMNPRDFNEATIHEGFIGVLPEYEGQGIATQMRKHAITHFNQAGFTGISTRISKNNIGSLRSAEKLGFKPIEEYYDEIMREERYYLILSFNKRN